MQAESRSELRCLEERSHGPDGQRAERIAEYVACRNSRRVVDRAVSEAVEKQLSRNDFSGYLDLKGACKFLSVGESQFKEWVRLGLSPPAQSQFTFGALSPSGTRAFMEEFLIKKRN